ncbi:MAG: replication initiation protein RepC [Hyphomicrobiales bacterium]|nr:replication initiation protein RepC [Hyphomicrobiales bacterium]
MKSWSEFLAAAGAVRPMTGISPDAWREAQDVLGKLEAHVVVATILQRSIHSSEAETMPGPAPGSTMGWSTAHRRSSPLAAICAPSPTRRGQGSSPWGPVALGPVLMAPIGQRLKRKRAA